MQNGKFTPKIVAKAREEMVINNDPDYKKEKEIPPEDIRKEMILDELRKESVSVIELAVMYAKTLSEYGVDMTRWKDRETLQEVYNKGYEDGFWQRKGRT